MDNTLEKIKSIVKNSPGLKATQVASKLGTDKKIINHYLYKNKFMFYQDKAYKWYLKDSSGAQGIEQNIPERKDTQLSKLCRYYLSCITYDFCEFSLFASSKYGLDYHEIKQLSSNDDFLLNEDIYYLQQKISKDKFRNKLYLGFPVALNKIHSNRSNWSGFKVEPFFIIPLEYQDGHLEMSDVAPMINIPFFKKFSMAESNSYIEDLLLLEEELGLTDDNNQIDLEELYYRFSSLKEDWPWIEEANPVEFDCNPKLSDVDKNGIYNRGIIFIGERSPYTQGLETELDKLSKLDELDFSDSFLGKIINHTISNKTEAPEPNILNVLPMNIEQREAVLKSLNSDLTVITGPPGTGKSQVVTNLIINATWNNKKVLFASKNNKAVDVVEARVNGISSNPVLLRLGSNQYQESLTGYITNIISTSSSQDEKDLFEKTKSEYFKLLESQKIIVKDQEKFVLIRNSIDELDQKLDEKLDLYSLEEKIKLKAINTEKLNEDINTLSLSITKCDKRRQSIFTRMFWKKVYPKRLEYAKRKIASFLNAYYYINVVPPKEIISEKTITEWLKLINDCKSSSEWINRYQKYSSLLEELKSKPSLEQLAKKQIELFSLIENCSSKLWDGWLTIKADSLTDSERGALSRYKTLLTMMSQSGKSGSFYKKVYGEYFNLFPRITSLLNCWAVTSLSARGKLPFKDCFFDIVIIDEASQCDIASALPLLYRAKSAVIIGDPNQLSHISTLHKQQDQKLLQQFDIIGGFENWAYSYNSLYDLAASYVKKGNIINLFDHHRSHKSIINFSNKFFYKNRLRVATSYEHLNIPRKEKAGVRWINIRGSSIRPRSGSLVNHLEAQAVVSELKRLVKESKYQGTIGVVSPFRAQANLIRKLVMDEEWSMGLIRNEFLADTVHKFQGDERDVMIFSPVISGAIPKGSELFLKGNGNLFNVAITRARAVLLVVGDIDTALHCNIPYMKSFAEYVSKLDSIEEKEIDYSKIEYGAQYPQVANIELVSDWEKIFYTKLFESGIRTIPQFQEDKYSLDLALFEGEAKLDIEIDGERYHKAWNGELCRRDQLRNQRLIELGWDVLRFWVYEIRDDIDDCVKRVIEWTMTD